MGAATTPTAAAAASATVQADRASPRPSEQAVSTAIEVAEARYAGVQEHLRTADAKAGLIATVQAAAFGILLAAAPAGRTALQLAADGLLLVALALSGAVITPALGGRDPHAASGGDPLWFGALRGWEPAELADHLVRQTPAERLAALTRQIVLNSRGAWRKFRLIRASLLCSAAALVVQVAAHLNVIGGA